MYRTKPVDRPTTIKMIKTILCAAIRTHLIHASLRLVSSMCVILLLAGCIQQEDAEDASENQKVREQDSVQRGGVYRYPLMNNPSTLDPVYLQDEYGAPVVRQLFEGLVQFGPYLTVLPALAQTWQVDNGGRTYRFFLRPDARFHNGHPVTAERRDIFHSAASTRKSTTDHIAPAAQNRGRPHIATSKAMGSGD
jgi:ABC-type oligopeptide transport system substrate-binding subunit